MGQHLSFGVRSIVSVSARSLSLRNCSLAQGCRIGLLRSATRLVGCRPFFSRQPIVDVGMVLIGHHRPRPGSRRLGQEIIADRRGTVQIARDPSNATVRGKVGYRCALLADRCPTKHPCREGARDETLRKCPQEPGARWETRHCGFLPRRRSHDAALSFEPSECSSTSVRRPRGIGNCDVRFSTLAYLGLRGPRSRLQIHKASAGPCGT
jgi:hypothetical protein